MNKVLDLSERSGNLDSRLFCKLLPSAHQLLLLFFGQRLENILIFQIHQRYIFDRNFKSCASSQFVHKSLKSALLSVKQFVSANPYVIS